MSKYKMKNSMLEDAHRLYMEGMSSTNIASIYGVSVNTILRGFKRLELKVRSNKENSRIYRTNRDDYFSAIDTDDKAYWLGLIYADGSVLVRSTGQKTFSMSLSVRDEAILHRLAMCLESNQPIKRYVSNGNHMVKSVEYSRLLITSDRLVDDLINQGVIQNKTNILKPPTLDTHLIRHFIRGYMDGDGSIAKAGKGYSVKFLGTNDMLNYISNYFLENELINQINKFCKRESYQIVSDVTYGGNIQSHRILSHLYKDSELYLSRKYLRYKHLSEITCRPCE